MPAGSTAEFPSPMNQTPPRSSSRARQLCMPACEVCENEYDKAFEIVLGGQVTPWIVSNAQSTRWRLFAALQLPNRRSRCRSKRINVLLRPLCTRVRHNAVEGPRLKVGRSLRGHRPFACRRLPALPWAGLTRDCEIQMLT